MTEHGFTVQILDRVYDVEFTPPILRESERELGRPIISSFRDERGWRGFTYDEMETLLWVQVRRQNKRLTRQKFQSQLDQHLSEKRGTLQEWHLALISAFNACDLWYRVERTDNEQEEASQEASAHPPTLTVITGTSAPPEASMGGSTS
jgi:hypothetical protein